MLNQKKKIKDAQGIVLIDSECFTNFENQGPNSSTVDYGGDG